MLNQTVNGNLFLVTNPGSTTTRLSVSRMDANLPTPTDPNDPNQPADTFALAQISLYGGGLNNHQGTIVLSTKFGLTGAPNDPLVERLRIHTDGNVGIGTTAASPPLAKLQVVGGAIMPAGGDSDSAGLLFPKIPGGGSGDAAWVRYYPRPGAVEAMTLEIGIGNDADDHIALMPSGGVGIGTKTPAGNHRLDVNGSIAIQGKHAFRGNDDWLRLNQDGQFTAGVRTPGNLAVDGTLTVGANPVRFTSAWSGFPDSTTNQAEISNDTNGLKTLAIVGNKSAGLGRRVSVWDRLEVNGELTVSAKVTAAADISCGGDLLINGGRKLYSSGRIHIHGDELLYLLNKSGVIIGKEWGGNGNLQVQGELTAGVNPVRFTSGWSGFPDSTTNQAEISNDTGAHKTLMIVGNKSAGMGRRVSVWDRLEVNGELTVSARVTAAADISCGGNLLISGGARLYSSGRMHIHGEELLYLLNKSGVIIGKEWGGNGNLTVEGDLNYGGVMTKLDVADNFTAIIRAGDFCLGHSGRRGSPGRALVDYGGAEGGNTLRINYGGDWSGGCRYYVSMDRASSRKLKNNVTDLPSEVADGILDGLNPVSFSLKSDTQPSSYLGFIAEDVPREVGAPDRGAVNTDHIVAVLTRVLKDQQQKILSLQAALLSLQGAVHGAGAG